VEEEAREHLVTSPDGRLRWRYSRPAVVTGYSELCTAPPPPSVIRVPALLIHASRFGLVREEQCREYADVLGDRLEVLGVTGGHVVYWDAYEETATAIESFLFRHARVTHA
jgi:lipase